MTEMVKYAAQLRLLVERMSPIFEVAAREVSRLDAVTPAIRCHDTLDGINMKLSSIEEARRDNLVKLKEKINEAKAKFIRGIDDRIKTIIRDCVVLQVSRRVEDHITKRTGFFRKFLGGNEDRMTRFRVMVDNVEVRNKNATIRPKFPGELLHPMIRPIPDDIPASPSRATASESFPRRFEDLLKLSAGEAKGLVTEYRLPESQRSGEEARLENLNQLMSHFGIGYRLNAGSPPIITSVWDR